MAKKTGSAPSQKLDQYIIRFPDGMRDWLKAEAEKSGRSMNAEIVYRMELTRGVDLEIDEMKRSRRDAGPVDHIDQELVALRNDIGAIKALLLKRLADGDK